MGDHQRTVPFWLSNLELIERKYRFATVQIYTQICYKYRICQICTNLHRSKFINLQQICKGCRKANTAIAFNLHRAQSCCKDYVCNVANVMQIYMQFFFTTSIFAIFPSAQKLLKFQLGKCHAWLQILTNL